MKNKYHLYLYLFLLIILIIISRIIINKNKPLKSDKTLLVEQLKSVPYYKKVNLSRYIDYQKKNKELSPYQIITNVNIGLDKPFYTDIKQANTTLPQITLVNKYNYLASDYIPNNLENISTKYSSKSIKLVKEAKESFETLASNAEQENLKIIALSAYRSYSYQETLYNNYVKKDGINNADKYSARPGHSEHQTGLAVDVYNGNISYTEFEHTKEFIWMQKNAHKYGFILRYPQNKEQITGYQYEPWHYRYVGIKIATDIHNKNLTYEEYYINYLNN